MLNLYGGICNNLCNSFKAYIGPMLPVQTSWTAAERFMFRFAFLYFLLFVLSFSFPHPLLPDIGKYTAPFFEWLVGLVGPLFFGKGETFTKRLISDSSGFYIHALLLVLISLVIASVWAVIDRRRKSFTVWYYWFLVMVRYYLAIQLLMYGLSKIFKWQFYLPEPNTFFTSLGQTNKDLLYWSIMGVSRSYSIFTGCAEVLAACLLLFKRTTLLGALLSIFVLVNVLAINFSFDISVKLYSCFLLCLAVVLIVPYCRALYCFFVKHGTETLRQWKPAYQNKKHRWLYVSAKTLLLIFICVDAFYIYWKANNFNDDAAFRPPLHGAYEVTTFVQNGDTMPPLLTDTLRWRRVFIHRKGYLIVQKMNDEMKDHQLAYDTVNQQLYIKQHQNISEIIFDYKKLTDTTLFLSGMYDNDTLNIFLKKIDLEQLPLLQKGFHWTIDQ